MKRTDTKKMVLLAMISAMAFMMVALIRIPVVLFLSYEPKDVIITIGGFILGPAAAFLSSLVVSLIEMFTLSDTGIIGAVMNLLSTCSFACTAAFIYKKKHTITGAIAGLAAGSVCMIAIMLLWNYLITPLYMGVEREVISGMLIPAFLPFNALKAGFNSALTLALYKPVVNALRKARLLSAQPKKSANSKWGIYLLAAALLATCVLLLLVLRGILYNPSPPIFGGDFLCKKVGISRF